VATAPSAAAATDNAAAFTRDVGAVDYSGVDYNEWDIDRALGSVPEVAGRERTVLIYMNGSDLESDLGAATLDLAELTRAKIDETRVNVVIFTGGANRWRNDVIPESECAVSMIRAGGLVKLTGVGRRDMGDAGTLGAFIKFAAERFPAERTSLIMWDHGGGSIAGYGHDEQFAGSTLTLIEMEYAFERAGLAERRLELLGFDACLMATVEMAVIAERYADYLIASEGLEPGAGWDYTAFGAAAAAEGGGLAVGRVIADAFMAANTRSGEEITISVIETARATSVMGALGGLTERLYGSLPAMEAQIQRRRAETKTFGDGSPYGARCDMVDITDFARQLTDMCPEEARALTEAVKGAVRYHKYESNRALGGMTAYHVFQGGEWGASALGVYRELGMSRAYTEYLTAFAASLPVMPENGRRAAATIGGRSAVMYEDTALKDCVNYAVPALVNGAHCDLIVRAKPDGASVAGYRREEGYIVQKGLETLKDGDRVKLLSAVDGDWEEGSEMVVTGGVSVEYNVSAGILPQYETGG
jgi:hypothetical protein